MPALAISDLTPRAGLLYCHVSEFYDDETGTVGSYGLTEACAECAGLGEEFREHYGTASDWKGCGIDFGELIHWAHSFG